MDGVFLLQHQWQDNTPFCDLQPRSYAFFRIPIASDHMLPSPWEHILACEIPDNIWKITWLKYRAECKNAFLWQLLYRVIATIRWCFPRRLATEISTWCTRCVVGTREDIIHCLWSCPVYHLCWQWGVYLLQQRLVGVINLQPAHVFFALPHPPHRMEYSW